MKFRKGLIALAIVVAITGCTRVPTGEVGIRMDLSRQIQPTELLPGSWNQEIVGSVKLFPVREISVPVANMHFLTQDNSALADFDVNVIYNINPSSVAELYSTKSKSFNHVDEKTGETLLLHSFMTTVVTNSAARAIRQYKSLEVADKREEISVEMLKYINETLKEEKLDGSLHISLIQVQNIVPNAAILESATQFVKSQNDLRIKENEVQIAKKEAERMAMLSQNSTQSIAYMNAQANMMIAQGIANGKVQTIVVPMDFRGQVVVK